MRITQTQEWVLAAVLIVYIAFTPGFQMVRSFLATPIGKAVGLAVIVYVWKYVSALLGLLLTVNFVRCAGMREGFTMSTCPEGTTAITDKPGKCKKSDGTEVDAVEVQPVGAPKAPEPKAPESAAMPPPAAGGAPSGASSGASSVTLPSPPAPPATNPAGFTNYGAESFIPREEGTGSFSPV